MNRSDSGVGASRGKPMGTAGDHDAAVINLDERQAAKFLGIGARTLWQMRKDGSVPHVKFGKSVRYPKPLLIKWLMEQATAGREETASRSNVGTTASTASRVESGELVNNSGN